MIRIPKTAFRYSSQHYIDLEDKYGCHNYHPLPVVIQKASGIYMYDIEGRKYFDFLSAYSAVNQGHCHPRIISKFIEQAKILTLTSRAFYTDKLGLAEQYLSETFGYDKVLFMNAGVEAGESAIKIARRWGYNIKSIPDNQARILFAKGNFWGRTIAACGSSDDPSRYYRFGPFNGLNFDLVEYNNIDAIEKMFKENPNYAAFMVEAIQGEMGVVIPQQGYLKKVKALCEKYNVLLIVDEIQSGLGRSGKLLCCEWDNVKPDMVLLGKALSGGTMPVSAVLANDPVMMNIKPGEHGSTFGGNPLAATVCVEAIKVLLEEKMVENSLKQGNRLLAGLQRLCQNDDRIKAVRGRGLWCALEFHDINEDRAMKFCYHLKDLGLLAKPTHDTTVRLSPPLVINEQEVDEALNRIEKGLKGF